MEGSIEMFGEVDEFKLSEWCREIFGTDIINRKRDNKWIINRSRRSLRLKRKNTFVEEYISRRKNSLGIVI